MVLCELSNQLLIVPFVVNYEPLNNYGRCPSHLIAGLELVCYWYHQTLSLCSDLAKGLHQARMVMEQCKFNAQLGKGWYWSKFYGFLE